MVFTPLALYGCPSEPRAKPTDRPLLWYAQWPGTAPRFLGATSVTPQPDPARRGMFSATLKVTFPAACACDDHRRSESPDYGRDEQHWRRSAKRPPSPDWQYGVTNTHRAQGSGGLAQSAGSQETETDYKSQGYGVGDAPVHLLACRFTTAQETARVFAAYCTSGVGTPTEPTSCSATDRCDSYPYTAYMTLIPPRRERVGIRSTKGVTDGAFQSQTQISTSF